MASNQAIEVVRFQGDDLFVIRGPDGAGWVVVRRMCEPLGLAEQKQAERLKRAPWACTTVMVAHDASGRNQELFCLHVDSVPMWLATIQVSRCAEAARPKLTEYQRGAAKALADWAYGRTPDLRVVPTTDRLEAALERTIGIVAHTAQIVAALSDQHSTVAAKVERIEGDVAEIRSDVADIRARMPEHRERISPTTKARHLAIVRRKYGDRCPCCLNPIVFDALGQPINAEFDHAISTGKAGPEHTWLVCRPCNLRFVADRKPEDRAAFEAYQRHVKRGMQLALIG